jgi:flagellar assembly protein FliH
MNLPRTDIEVVLRNTLLHPEAVRIGRRDARPPTAPASAGVPAVAPAAATAPALDRDALLEAALVQAREEGLRAGREEGLRLGREEGLRAGYEDGAKKGQAEAQALARAALEKAIAEAAAPLRERERQLASLAASLAAQEAAWRAIAEDEAVALAYELAGRVLGAALVTPEGVRAQAQQLLASTRPRTAAFHVHPDDLPVLQQEAAAGTGLCWVADAAVATGGCIVKGASGALDARLETLLEECSRALLEVRARRAGGAAA